MRILVAAWMMLAAAVCIAADTPVTPAQPWCSDTPGSPACNAPAKDIKAARAAFERGVKLERSKSLDASFAEFQQASDLIPQNVDYITAREMVRQQLVAVHLERGNRNLDGGRQVEALAEFRIALELDPKNEFAQQRMRDAFGPPPTVGAPGPQLVASASTPAPAATPGIRDFHYGGNSRDLISTVASSFGVTAIFDDSMPSRNVRFDVQDVDFPQAMQAVSAATHSFFVPLEGNVIYVANDTPDNHRSYDRMGFVTYYVPGASTPQELNDYLNGLRSLFDLRFISMDAAAKTITVRGPQPTLDALTHFFESLDSTRPEVLLDIRAFEIDRTFARNIGLHIPNQFTLFNIPAGALAALGGQNIQDLVNQLIASGGINQAGNLPISALLAQLAGQQNSIFSQPVATFGGGLTFMGLTLDQLRATLSLNESSLRALEHVTLRAQQDKDATFKIGSRYPILNASFAPIFNSPAISQVVSNNTFTPAFPSINYEDIGLVMKAKPIVHANSDVNLQLEIQFRNLEPQSVNGIPVISNREYKGSIALKEGEPAVVAGIVSSSEQKTLNGLPGFAHVPGLNYITAENGTEEQDQEILIVITPYVVSNNERRSSEIWLGK
jgi:hypothetical protein